MNTQAKYVVHYLKGYGRAEPIRFLLSHAGIEFTEAYHTFVDILAFKMYNDLSFGDLPQLQAEGKLEFGQVPVLEDNGKFYAQSGSILRLLGQRHGYYPQDFELAHQADSTIDAVQDIFHQNSFQKDIFYSYYTSTFNPDEKQRAELLSEFKNSSIHRYFSAFEKRLLNNNSGFFVGDKITIADFSMGSLNITYFYISLIFSLYMNPECPNQKIILEEAEKYPKLMEYSEGLKHHLNSRLANRLISPW